MSKIKRYSEYEYIREDLPFDSYPGPSLIAKPYDWVNPLYPKDDEVEDDGKYSFSYPHSKNGPDITRWSGDNRAQLRLHDDKYGENSAKIGGEFDSDGFSPGGEIERNLDDDFKDIENYEDDEDAIIDPKEEAKDKVLKYLKQINKK
jgi:hypothetical protein